MKNDSDTINPSYKPSSFGIRAETPTPEKKLNSKSIYIAGAVFAAACAGVFLMAFSGASATANPPPTTNKPEPVASDALSKLPSSYAEVRKKMPEPLAQPRYLQPSGPTAEERLWAEARAQRLKRALEARASDVSFRLPSNSRQGAGGGDSIGSILPGVGALPSLPQMPGGLTSNPRDEASRQDDKVSFLEERRGDETSLRARLKTPSSPYQVLAGTMIPGVMLTGINSDLPGQLLGQVSQAVYDTANGTALLIPQGTKLIGTYDSRIVYGQERVLVVWTRLLFPNGRSISLEGMPGVDLSGYSGLADKVNNHYGKLLTGVVLGSMLGAGAQVAEGSTSVINPSFGQLATAGLAKNTNEVGQEITRKNLNIQPTIEISPGMRFNVFVTKDINLVPYDD